jgi:hypothetical protein
VQTFRAWRTARAWAQNLKIGTNIVVCAHTRRLKAGVLRVLAEHSVRRYMYEALDTDLVVTGLQYENERFRVFAQAECDSSEAEMH